MSDQTIVHCSGLRGATPEHGHGATTVGERFVTHRRFAVTGHSEDRPRPITGRGPPGAGRARFGAESGRVAVGSRGCGGACDTRDERDDGGRFPASPRPLVGRGPIGRGRLRRPADPSSVPPRRPRSGGVRSRGARPASRHRAPGRPEPVGAGVPGVVPRVRAAGVCSGPGAWAGHGDVRAWSRTAGVGPAHDAHPRASGWSGRFGVGRSVVRSRAVPGGGPVRTPGRAGSRGPRPVRGHGRRACGTAGGRGSSRCPRRGRARGRSGRCSCPGSSRAAPGARAR